MAVYTRVSAENLHAFLTSYDIGTLISHEGIAAGVSNTNYFVTTDRARFVLTLFEPHRVNADEIPYFLNYAIVLEQSGVPCPKTMMRKDGSSLAQLCGRPAAIFSVLDGEGGTVSMLNPAYCEKAGAVLAEMHLAAAKIMQKAPNQFGLPRWKAWMRDIAVKMDDIHPRMHDFTKDELRFIETHWPGHLPAGSIHADYFPDNVFFKGGEITGVIDFHFVCTDLFAYDLAIALNAWSFDADNHFHKDRMDALMRGYDSVRPLIKAEKEAMPVLLRAAALRFLLSRIEEKLKWKPDDFMTPHDPIVFEKRLRHFQAMAVPA